MGKAIGIDFGTTNTVVSYLKDGAGLRQIKYGRNSRELIPTALYFLTRDNYIIGEKARNKGLVNPAALVQNFKTHLGESGFAYRVSPEKGEPFRLSPTQAMNYFLNQLIGGVNQKLEASFGFDGHVDSAVITVPATFGPGRINDIKRAAVTSMHLESNTVKTVFEPTAARAAHAEESPGETILIYDFGGGTFDVSLMRYDGHKHQQLWTDGDPELGGNNFTDILAQYLLDSLNDEHGTSFTLKISDYDPEDFPDIDKTKYGENISAVWEAANSVKEELSQHEETDAMINIWLNDEESTQFITTVFREDLIERIMPDLEKTMEITARAARQAEGQIDRIILAGGSSRIPLIRTMLAQRLNRAESDIEITDEVMTLISRGAAVLAQNMKEIDALTEQVTSRQIGVATTEGMQLNKFHMIIPDGAKLPATGSEIFSLAMLPETATTLSIRYYEYDARNYPEAMFVDEKGITGQKEILINLPPDLDKQMAVVKMTFEVKTDSTIEFTAEVQDQNGLKINDAQASFVEGDLM